MDSKQRVNPNFEPAPNIVRLWVSLRRFRAELPQNFRYPGGVLVSKVARRQEKNGTRNGRYLYAHGGIISNGVAIRIIRGPVWPSTKCYFNMTALRSVSGNGEV